MTTRGTTEHALLGARHEDDRCRQPTLSDEWKTHLGASWDEDQERALEKLLEQREAIERELDLQLEWNPHPEKRQKTIKLTHLANLQDRAAWPEAIAWLTKTAVAFHGSFAPRVAQLDLNLL